MEEVLKERTTVDLLVIIEKGKKVHVHTKNGYNFQMKFGTDFETYMLRALSK